MDDFLKFALKATLGLVVAGVAVELGRRAKEDFSNARKELGENIEIKL